MKVSAKHLQSILYPPEMPFKSGFHSKSSKFYKIGQERSFSGNFNLNM